MVFLLGLTAFQTAQRLYSSAINMLLAMFAAVAAFNFYEPLGAAIDGGSGYGPGMALIILFAFTYAVLRILADWRFKNDLPFPRWIDKVGAAVTGFVTAMVGVGVILVGLQMLPLPSKAAVLENPERVVVEAAPIIYYDRYPVDVIELAAGKQQAESHLEAGEQNFWLQPDRFSIGLFGLFSETGLRGPTRFQAAHPDLLQEAYAYRSVPHYYDRSNKSRNFGRHVIADETVQVRAYRFNPPELFFKAGEYVAPARGRRHLLVQIHVDPEALDEDNQLRFSGLQMLLRTVAGAGEGAVVRNRFPCGWSEPTAAGGLTRLQMRSPRDTYAASMTAQGQDLLLLFELDEAEQETDHEMPAGLRVKGSSLRPFPPASANVALPGSGAPHGEIDQRPIRNVYMTTRNAMLLKKADNSELRPPDGLRFIIVQADFHLRQFPLRRLRIGPRILGAKPVLLKTEAGNYAAHGWSADGKRFHYHQARNAKEIVEMTIPLDGLTSQQLHHRVHFLFEVDQGVGARALQYADLKEERLE